MNLPPSIHDDTPLRLIEACRLFFRGALTPAALRRESRKGNLVIERIANKDFVTPAAIRAMRTKCRVTATKAPSKSNYSHTDRSPEDGTTAQNALRLKLRMLRER